MHVCVRVRERGRGEYNHEPLVQCICLGHSFISLESVQARGHYVGVTDAGDCKSHLSGGISDNEKFYVIPVQPVSYYYY